MNLYTIQYEDALTTICFIVAIVIVLFAQFRVSYAYKKYKKIKNSKNMTGVDVARTILDSNGLDNIYVVEARGNLTDHYDPTRKVVKLSTDIFHGESVAALAVAAHECGHALQDKNGYTFMKIRSALVPFVNLVTYLGYFGIFVGLLAGITGYLLIGILVLLVTLLFQLVTLPVEFDASKRAKETLKTLEIADSDELEGVDKVLSAAAMTYVASALSTLLNVLRLILMFTKDD